MATGERQGLTPCPPQGVEHRLILRDLMVSLNPLALWQASSKLPVDEPDGFMQFVFGINLTVAFNAIVSGVLENAMRNSHG